MMKLYGKLRQCLDKNNVDKEIYFMTGLSCELTFQGREKCVTTYFVVFDTISDSNYIWTEE